MSYSSPSQRYFVERLSSLIALSSTIQNFTKYLVKENQEGMVSEDVRSIYTELLILVGKFGADLAKLANKAKVGLGRYRIEPLQDNKEQYLLCPRCATLERRIGLYEKKCFRCDLHIDKLIPI